MPDFPALIDLATLGSAGWSMFGGTDNDRVGQSVSSAGDVNGDGFEDFILGVPLNSAGGSEAGRVYVIYGKGSGFSTIDNLGAITTADGFMIQGDLAGDKAGFSVSAAGDLNGDGIGDILVGARYGDNGGPDAGEAYVIFGKSGTRANIDLTSLAAPDGFIIQGDASPDQTGISVSAAGDFNDDGIDDILVGAHLGGGVAANAGRAYVIFGHTGAFADIDLTSLGAAGVVFRGQTTNDHAGVSVSSAGDFNGDGIDDILIGATTTNVGDPPTAFNNGTVYVVFGTASPDATVDLAALGATEGFTIRGKENDQAGWSLASAGDVNGDGFGDIILGIPYNDDGGTTAGAAYVIFGKASGFSEINLANPLAASEGFAIIGDLASDFVGNSVAGAGDVNGDGFDDVIVGGPNGEATPDYSTGQAYVIYGKASGFGTIDLGSALPDTVGFTIQGAEDGQKAGTSVSSAGDINGDGFADMLVGAPHVGHYDPLTMITHSADGAAYVIFGRAPTTAVTRVGSAASQTIRGGAFNDVLSGLAGDDRLYGNDGNDSLDGGTGADRMSGGLGNDTYYVDNVGDRALESSNVGGTDIVNSSITYSLAGQQIEKLFLTGGSAIDATGNSLANTLVGNSAANTLDGAGGIDVMNGGAGNDIYVVYSSSSSVIESAGGGTDLVRSYATFSLSDAYEVENITLIGSAAVNASGNNLVNSLIGNGAANTLNGRGGADTMNGGNGNDTYIVDNLGDVAIEGSSTGGTDSVQSSVTFSLVNQFLENLTLTGANPIDGTGNSLANRITGNNAANRLDGGTNADILSGGNGNDVYVVDNSGDRVIETSASGGNDTVESRVSFDLAGIQIETLTLTGPNAVNGTGNSLVNTINGNAANNILKGNGANDVLSGADGADKLYGGTGNDGLTGGAGTDGFYFDTALSAATNVDQIADYVVADDTIFLSRAIFAGITLDGTLNSNAFRAGTAAVDADDRIMYDQATGNIYYDADGFGGAGATLFAHVTAGTLLTNLDFSAYTP